FYQNRKAEPWEDARNVAPIPSVGPRAAITPGIPDGVLLALEKYGTMSFAQIAEPAIEYADAFAAPEIYAQYLAMNERMLAFWATSVKFFFPSGKVPKPGEVVHMPDLARTLRDMVAAEKKAKGNREAKIRAVHDYFYKGPVAKHIVAFNESVGGLIAYDD